MDIRQVSANCAQYIPIDDPRASFTFTYEGSNIHPTGESWTYRPCDTNPELINGKDGVTCLKRIASMLPKIDLPMNKLDGYDYPALDGNGLSMIGIDYHLNREVFIIGGHAFFRRYNDDWYSAVMSGNMVSRGFVSWQNFCSTEVLLALEKLLQTKSCEKITGADIQAILKN